MTKKRLPKFLRQYFWDVDFGKIDIEKHRIYIIRRILDCGAEKAVLWIFENFQTSDIKNVLTEFRGFSQKSANFWALVLDVPREKVLCLKKRLSEEPKIVWPY